VACAFAMLTVYENLFLRMDRPTGPFDNANLYGNYLMLNVFLALGAHNLLTEDRTGGVSGGPGFLRAARILFLVGALPALAIGISRAAHAARCSAPRSACWRLCLGGCPDGSARAGSGSLRSGRSRWLPPSPGFSL